MIIDTNSIPIVHAERKRDTVVGTVADLYFYMDEGHLVLRAANKLLLREFINRMERAVAYLEREESDA